MMRKGTLVMAALLLFDKVCSYARSAPEKQFWSLITLAPYILLGNKWLLWFACANEHTNAFAIRICRYGFSNADSIIQEYHNNMIECYCLFCTYSQSYLSRDMRFPTMWYVRLAKPQISLTPFGVSKLKRGLHRLVWIYTCQYATLLEITLSRFICLCT